MFTNCYTINCMELSLTGFKSRYFYFVQLPFLFKLVMFLYL